MDMISGDWTKLDQDNKITEISFSTKDELIAKIKFDFINDEVLVEGDLNRVSESEDNTRFIESYKESSKEILNIL